MIDDAHLRLIIEACATRMVLSGLLHAQERGGNVQEWVQAARYVLAATDSLPTTR